jgi:hypothetical protein
VRRHAFGDRETQVDRRSPHRLRTGYVPSDHNRVTTAIAYPEISPLLKRWFDALAGYTRRPFVILLTEEIEWYATSDERVLGVVTKDRTDHDFGWVALGRDEQLRFRAVAASASAPDADSARKQLRDRLYELAAASDNEFHQGDSNTGPIDFFTPLVPPERLHPTFRVLTSQERYSPAREVIAAMMRFHDDADGNFVEQFQTTGFYPRLWELYLFATFNERGMVGRQPFRRQTSF